MGDPEQDYFVEGMHEALISNLAKIGALRVISRTSVMSYGDARKPLPEIARELGVDAVVEGSVLLAGGQVRINAQLIHAPTDTHLWADDYQGDLRNILTLQSETARAIAREIRAVVTPEEEARLTTGRQVDLEAYEAYLRGRYHLNRRTKPAVTRALEYFQQAIGVDPGDAMALRRAGRRLHRDGMVQLGSSGGLVPEGQGGGAQGARDRQPDRRGAHLAGGGSDGLRLGLVRDGG